MARSRARSSARMALATRAERPSKASREAAMSVRAFSAAPRMARCSASAGLFAGLRIELVELAEAQGQFFGLGGRAGDVGAQGLGAFAGRAPVAPALRHHCGFGAGEGVEQRPMSARVQQADRLVLAVDLHQDVADLLEHADARRLVVDEGARPAVGAQCTAQHKVLLAVIGQALVFQQVPDRVGRFRSEGGGGHGLGRAAPHEARLGARAGRQPQGVEDDGLARPRLAGERGQAWADGEVQGLDQHHVPDRQTDQHGRQDRLESGPPERAQFTFGSAAATAAFAAAGASGGATSAAGAAGGLIVSALSLRNGIGMCRPRVVFLLGTVAGLRPLEVRSL
jgi:hypothetical protein